MRRVAVAMLCMMGLVGGSLVGCEEAGLRTEVVGSGVVVTEQRAVSGFDRVSVSGPGTVHIEITGTESLEVEAEDNILEVLTIEVVGGRLELGTEPFTSLEPTREIVYRITAAQLAGVDVSGSAQVDIAPVDTLSFSAAISGSGSIEPTGSVTELEVAVSGSGRFLGEGLESVIADVSISGSGQADVLVTDELNASVSGSGAIRYMGDPLRVEKEISGSGSITEG